MLQNTCLSSICSDSVATCSSNTLASILVMIHTGKTQTRQEIASKIPFLHIKVSGWLKPGSDWNQTGLLKYYIVTITIVFAAYGNTPATVA